MWIRLRQQNGEWRDTEVLNADETGRDVGRMAATARQTTKTDRTVCPYGFLHQTEQLARGG